MCHYTLILKELYTDTKQPLVSYQRVFSIINQLKDAAKQCRRTNKFQECFRVLPDEFTTEKFAQVFGYANNRAAQKTLQRLEADKAIERTMRGHYKKLVSELPTI